MNVPFAIPETCADELDEVVEVIRSGWLTTASRCAAFEEDFRRFIGCKHALVVNSATAALHLGLEALGIKPADKVLVPTFTFTATAEVVRYLGADPVFVDCDPETFCIDASQIYKIIDAHSAERIEHSIKAIIPVHFAGHACEMDEILSMAGQQGWKVMEDAAHALPTRYKSIVQSAKRIASSGRGQEKEGDEIRRLRRFSQIESERVSRKGAKPQSFEGEQSSAQRIEQQPVTDTNHGHGALIGTFGDVTCFSFYANKTMTTGEGGMLCTDDDEIAKRVKVMRLHGINRDVWDRFTTGASWEYDVVAPGFKYNLTDICAAIGIHQLKKVELFREKRQRVAGAYYEGLKDVPGLILPRIRCGMEDHSWYLYIVLIEARETVNGIDRNRFIEEMTKRDIGTSVHYKPLHRMTYYRERYNLRPETFPNAEWVFERCVSLPMFSAMRQEQVEYVIESVRDILGHK